MLRLRDGLVPGGLPTIRTLANGKVTTAAGMLPVKFGQSFENMRIPTCWLGLFGMFWDEAKLVKA
jgi:hypothetical protein